MAIHIILVVIFIFNIVSSFLMGKKYIELHKQNRVSLKEHMICLNMCLGATMGILLWSYVIGFAVSQHSGVSYHMVQIAFFGSLVSIIPCVFGIKKVMQIKRDYKI